VVRALLRVSSIRAVLGSVRSTALRLEHGHALHLEVSDRALDIAPD
jgi:hypothetical protein